MTDTAAKFMTNMPPMRVNSPDHFQTPPYALTPLLPHLSRMWRIWEPACGKGNIVRTLCDAGFRTFGTDIEGQEWRFDFITDTQVTVFDAIVTNPPFSLKDEFLTRCYELGRPFALLLPLTALEGQRRQALYRRHGVEILIPNRRIAFETPSGREGKESSPQFLTAWYTWGLKIGQSLTFVDLPKPTAKPARDAAQLEADIAFDAEFAEEEEARRLEVEESEEGEES